MKGPRYLPSLPKAPPVNPAWADWAEQRLREQEAEIARCDAVLGWLATNTPGALELCPIKLPDIAALDQAVAELKELLADLAMENKIVGLGDAAAEVNDQTGVLGRVREVLGSDFLDATSPQGET